MGHDENPYAAPSALGGGSTEAALAASFQHDSYVIRRKVFKLFGGAFHIYDAAMEHVLFYAEQKAFKLKEDFLVYADEGKTTPLLRIRARSVIDFGATYDITDAKSGQILGSARRKGFASMVRDSWELYGPRDELLASAQEDSLALAMVRRLLSNLVPQTFDVKGPDEALLARFAQHFNPFVFRMTLDYSSDLNHELDRRLGIGLAVCMTAIEGRQS